MATRRWSGAAGAISAALLLGATGCGNDNNNPTSTPTPQVEGDNLKLDIQSATLPESGPPTVTFRVTDLNGNPFNLDAELASTTAPRTNGPRFTLAVMDDNGDYLSYYSTTTAPKAYTYVPDPEVVGTTTPFVPPTPAPRTQATAPAFAKANLKNLGNGVYEYTMPAPPTRTGFDRAKTHTVAGWISRTLADTSTSAGGSFNFVPAGGTAQKLETVTDAACNRCHGQLTAHGSRRNTQLCITCHSPQTGDPETDRTLDFKVFIHKLHRGADLPSVQSGKPYYMVGGSTVHDWSDIEFPWHDHGVAHCTVCHSGEDKDDWKKNPSAAVCTSCHDNVRFGAGEATVPCNDPNLKPGQDCAHVVAINVTPANVNDRSLCSSCHATGSSVAPIDKFHHGD